MAVKTLQEFLSASKEKDLSGETFELESSHMLEARVDGMIWAKAGSMIARKGNIKFTRQGLLDQGKGMLTQAEDLIRSKPLASFGVAFAAGYLAAALTRRK